MISMRGENSVRRIKMRVLRRRRGQRSTNLLNIPKHKVFGKKEYWLHAEYPKLHYRKEIYEDKKGLKARNCLVKTIPTAYGFAIYTREK